MYCTKNIYLICSKNLIDLQPYLLKRFRSDAENLYQLKLGLHERSRPEDETFMLTIQKSKFLAHIGVVYSHEQAMSFLAMVKKTESKATHHCWAYRTTLRNNTITGDSFRQELLNVMRCSDDGEPVGTAGKPILSAIGMCIFLRRILCSSCGICLTLSKILFIVCICAISRVYDLESFNLTNTAVVVARYFGGKELGTGGLARAYGGAAKSALQRIIGDSGASRANTIPLLQATPIEVQISLLASDVEVLYRCVNWAASQECCAHLETTLSQVPMPLQTGYNEVQSHEPVRRIFTLTGSSAAVEVIVKRLRSQIRGSLDVRMEGG